MFDAKILYSIHSIYTVPGPNGHDIKYDPRANGAKRRARVLIPHGYLHPGKGKHSEV